MPLDADQKAMLRLLAQREQGYEDIGALMGLSVDEVRSRVREALAELDEAEPAAPQAPPEEKPTPPPVAEEPQPTPPPPSRSPAPAESFGARQPRLRMPKDRRRAFELLGGVVLVLLVILFATGAIDIGGGGSDSSTTSTTASENEATSRANPKLTQAILKPVNGGGASGRALFGRIGKKVALQVEAEGLEPAPQGQAYVIWLARSPKVMVPLTPVSVGKSGQIAAQYPLPTQILGYLAGGAFDEIDLSLVSAPIYKVALAKARKAGKPPTYTGNDVLRGPITGPIVGAALKNSRP